MVCDWVGPRVTPARFVNTLAKNAEWTGSFSDGSGGWRNGGVVGVSDDEEDEEGSGNKGPGGAMESRSNEYVNVVRPEDSEGDQKGEVPRGEHALKQDAVTPLHKKSASSLKTMGLQPPTLESGADSTDTF